MNTNLILNFNGTEIQIDEIDFSEDKEDESGEQYCEIELNYTILTEGVEESEEIQTFIKEEVQKIIDMAIQEQLDVIKE